LCRIDATRETVDFGMGRLINHSRKKANVFPRVEKCVNNDGMAGGNGDGKIPRLIFYAGRDIEPDEELLYDYGDYSHQGLKENPWLES